MKSLYNTVEELFDAFNAGFPTQIYCEYDEDPLFCYLMDGCDYLDREVIIDILSPHNIVMNPKPIDRYGGEDQGTDLWTIYEFTRGDEMIYIRYEGYYSSYDENSYDRQYQVFPKEITKTIYVKENQL
jgi:hypothetical protein